MNYAKTDKMGVKITYELHSSLSPWPYICIHRPAHPESAGIWEAAWDCAAQEGSGPGEMSMIQTDSCVIKLSPGSVFHSYAHSYNLLSSNGWSEDTENHKLLWMLFRVYVD